MSTDFPRLYGKVRLLAKAATERAYYRNLKRNRRKLKVTAVQK